VYATSVPDKYYAAIDYSNIEDGFVPRFLIFQTNDPFPVMTFTEYKFLENWMKENNYPVEKIYERAELIQQDYEKKYGTRLFV
jgi:hypothetical protein